MLGVSEEQGDIHDLQPRILEIRRCKLMPDEVLLIAEARTGDLEATLLGSRGATELDADFLDIRLAFTQELRDRRANLFNDFFLLSKL